MRRRGGGKSADGGQGVWVGSRRSGSGRVGVGVVSGLGRGRVGVGLCSFAVISIWGSSTANNSSSDLHCDQPDSEHAGLDFLGEPFG